MIEAKKGEKVIVKGFTGIKLGVFEVSGVTKKTVSVIKRNGDEMIFDRKTGRQTNVEEGKEKYANIAMDDDGSYVAPVRGKKPVKKTNSKSNPEPEEDDDEDDEEDEKPLKKSGKKKPAKKTKASVVEDDDEDEDDEFEEVDDD